MNITRQAIIVKVWSKKHGGKLQNLQFSSKNGKNSRIPENAIDNADLQPTMLLN